MKNSTIVKKPSETRAKKLTVSTFRYLVYLPEIVGPNKKPVKRYTSKSIHCKGPEAMRKSFMKHK